MERWPGKWMVFLADPQGVAGTPPEAELPAGALDALFYWAEAHGVLGAVLQNIAPFAPAGSAAALRNALRSHHAATGLGLMLRQRARRLDQLPAFRNLRATFVKGASFADRLYPSARLRRFTDLDILVDEDDSEALFGLLEQEGYERAAMETLKPECVDWFDPAQPNVTIDVQTDLVHSAAIRKAFRLRYRDIRGESRTDPHRPAALLLTAAVHGAMHQYERLVQVVDVLQGARALARSDVDDFLDLVDRTGTSFVARSGLAIAAGLFADDHCAAVAGRIAASSRALLSAALITESVVAARVKQPPWRVFWRRRLYRELLKVPGR